MFIVVSLEVISGLGTIILSVTANLNFWSRAIFWTLALPEKCTDPERKSMRTRSVCGFLPGLALMKTTAWKSMRTLLYFRLDTLLTKLPSYFVRHSSVGPQQPWIVYYRIQWSEWVVGVGRHLECGLLFGRKDNITAIKVEVRTYRMKV